MNQLPGPQPGATPFGAPQSGFSTGGSPLVSPPTGGNGRRMLIAGAAGLCVIGAAIAVFAVSGGSDSADQSRDDAADAQAVADSLIADAETALAEAQSTADEALEQVEDAVATVPVESAPIESPAPIDSSVPATSLVDTTLAPVAVPTTVPAPISLFEGDQIGAIVDEVAAARGAEPLRMLELVVYPEYLLTDVQDPAIPENVDQYTWRGQLGAPAPVRLVGNGELEPNLFSSNEVDWSAIPALIAAAPAAVGIDDGVVSHVIVHRNLPFTDAITMRAFVRSERDDGYVDADANAVITGVSD